jgi:hypothetical protein
VEFQAAISVLLGALFLSEDISSFLNSYLLSVMSFLISDFKTVFFRGYLRTFSPTALLKACECHLALLCGSSNTSSCYPMRFVAVTFVCSNLGS